jgi:soluble lytic murein transglycosylase-like protein
VGSHAPRRPRRAPDPKTSCYLERALLLWPRLDRSKIRRVANDPARIAEIVVKRTSQPYEVILAMLTRQSSSMQAAQEESPSFEHGRPETPRIGLRIVRSGEGTSIEVQDLLHA